MCILSYLPAGVPVDEDGLFNGGLSNPDGHGWAIADPTSATMLVGKSLDLVTAIDDFKAARAEHPNGHALFHSRWATHGSITTDNVHPFFVGGSESTVVGHNGVLPRSAHPAKGDDRSDTRLFADEILSTRYRRLNRDRVRTALSNWIGSGNKLVILTVDPRYRRNAYLVNEHLGTWDRKTGIWHSNHDFESAPWWLYSKGAKGAQKGTQAGKRGTYERWQADVNERIAERWPYTDTAEYGGYEACFYCHGAVTSGGYCMVCGTCQDCLEPMDDCLCYQSAVAALPAGSPDTDPNDTDGSDPYVYYARDDEDIPTIG